MMPNINPETNIRYGVISSHSIDPDIFDVLFEQAQDYMCKDCPCEKASEDRNCEECQHYFDELTGNFDYEGVKGKISMLGGCYLVFVTFSPHIVHCHPCSPCVPGAGDLDNPNGNVECYGVPEDWKNN